MERLISATEARKRFRSVLRDVEAGNSYVVTMHGVPVARIKPEAKQQSRSKGQAALLKRLHS